MNKEDADWMTFSSEYLDPATGFRWAVDCLGARSFNQDEAEACTLQFQYGDSVRYAEADPANLIDPEEIARAFADSGNTPPTSR